MSAEDVMPVSELRKIVRHDPETGKLFWLPRTADMFSNVRKMQDHWNFRYAGKEAFKTKNDTGYLEGFIFGKKYKTHRVIWAMHYGEWPKSQIDHIDGNRANNLLSNLRAVSIAENAKNRGLLKSNSSGVIGVSWHKSKNKWQANICVQNKRIALGRYENFDDAVRARKEAERVYGYHEMHGQRPAFSYT
jgi:hypothetical protein